jgi:DNA-binding CsgD family transcriptional regulator
MITNGAILLTEKIMGSDDVDVSQIMKQIALSNNLKHIAHLRFIPKKSNDLSLLAATVTYPIEWQHRYFEKQYVLIDPVVSHGLRAVMPFDWIELMTDDPQVHEFFMDAARFELGNNGITIPIRARDGSVSIVSFTSDHRRADWEQFKRESMPELQMISVLVDTAANTTQRLRIERRLLSQREEQCLVWAARGKTYEDISDILGISYASVKRYLDTARHKLNCINLTHAVAVAIATGVIPAKSVR